MQALHVWKRERRTSPGDWMRVALCGPVWPYVALCGPDVACERVNRWQGLSVMLQVARQHPNLGFAERAGQPD